MTQSDLFPTGYLPKMRARKAVRQTLAELDAIDRAYERSQIRASLETVEELQETETTAFELVARSRKGYGKVCSVLKVDDDAWDDTWERNSPCFRTEELDLSRWCDGDRSGWSKIAVRSRR